MPKYSSPAPSNRRRMRPIVIAIAGQTSPSRGNWCANGLCIGEDPELFFPSHGDPGTEAREICAACPVRDDCLRYATQADENGIWGGLDQDERRNLKGRQHRRKAAHQAAGNQHERTA
jgi:hypothetical protein